MHAWVYNEWCKWIGVKDNPTYPAFDILTPIPSELKYMVMFKIHATHPPWIKYADMDYGPRASGWQLYYPERNMEANWYYYRYFDCHRP